MIIKKANENIPASEITDPAFFNHRRKILKAFLATLTVCSDISPIFATDKSELINSYEKKLETTSSHWMENYTNYYEFTFDKEDAFVSLIFRVITWLKKNSNIENFSVSSQSNMI